MFVQSQACFCFEFMAKSQTCIFFCLRNEDSINDRPSANPQSVVGWPKWNTQSNLVFLISSLVDLLWHLFYWFRPYTYIVPKKRVWTIEANSVEVLFSFNCRRRTYCSLIVDNCQPLASRETLQWCSLIYWFIRKDITLVGASNLLCHGRRILVYQSTCIAWCWTGLGLFRDRDSELAHHPKAKASLFRMHLQIPFEIYHAALFTVL